MVIYMRVADVNVFFAPSNIRWVNMNFHLIFVGQQITVRRFGLGNFVHALVQSIITAFSISAILLTDSTARPNVTDFRLL